MVGEGSYPASTVLDTLILSMMIMIAMLPSPANGYLILLLQFLLMYVLPLVICPHRRLIICVK